MRRTYIPKKFGLKSQTIIAHAMTICQEYADQGYDLTLRQLYYQFVARDLIPNTQSEYKRLGSIVNDARLAGYLDWDFIVDRTRNLRRLATWDSPASIVRGAAAQYRRDLWADQTYRPEVWVEKDALTGVIEQACELHRVPWFSCRGYTSQSEIWGAAQRLNGYVLQGQVPVVLHLGDHDPSGIDMSRDILDRLRMFMVKDWFYDGMADQEEADWDEIMTHMEEFVAHLGAVVPDGWAPVIVDRIALNMDQVDQYNPPPNPAKLSDSRARSYIENYGYESWELDALDPATLTRLIRDQIGEMIDWDIWEEASDRELGEKAAIENLATTL